MKKKIKFLRGLTAKFKPQLSGICFKSQAEEPSLK